MVPAAGLLALATADIVTSRREQGVASLIVLSAQACASLQRCTRTSLEGQEVVGKLIAADGRATKHGKEEVKILDQVSIHVSYALQPKLIAAACTSFRIQSNRAHYACR
jgi:hypothetical protein